MIFFCHWMAFFRLCLLLINWRTENVENFVERTIAGRSSSIFFIFWTHFPLFVHNWIDLFGKLCTNFCTLSQKNNAAHQLMVSSHLLKFVRFHFFFCVCGLCSWQTILRIGTIETISIEFDLILETWNFSTFYFYSKFQKVICEPAQYPRPSRPWNAICWMNIVYKLESIWHLFFVITLNWKQTWK